MADKLAENYKGVFDTRLGFGRKSALIVIDLIKAYTTEGSPLYAPGVVECVKELPEILHLARSKNVPILYTTIRYTPPDFSDAGVWVRKAPLLKTFVEGNPLAESCEEIAPQAGDVIINKHYASAFFGTSLVATLNGMEVDTLILTGCTTSGCIRATAVDTIQYGFRPICIRECVGDRHHEPHEANLFDINAKYGDVISKAEATKYLLTL